MTFSIIYRTYSGETDGNLNRFRPTWFSKFRCWKSFWDEFGKKTDVIVLWDGEPFGELYEYIKSFGPKIFNYGKLGNLKSLLKTYELLKILNTNVIATVEDDFLIFPECLDVLQEGFCMGFPMMSTYEHIDRYDLPSHDVSFGKDEIYKGSRCYFRSVESTTGTCFFRKNIFDSLYNKLITYNVNDREFFRDCYFNGFRLYSSMPGYSTHVCIDNGKNLMSPFIDWEAFSNSIIL